MKIGFLSGIDLAKFAEQAQKIQTEEIKTDQEWVLFDDDTVSSFGENWAGVIKLLIEQQAYPTVLFYERLEEIEQEGVPFKPSIHFQLTDLTLKKL